MHLLKAEVDVITIAKMAGIKDIRAIARYDRRGEEAKQKAARLLRVPYKPRKNLWQRS